MLQYSFSVFPIPLMNMLIESILRSILNDSYWKCAPRIFFFKQIVSKLCSPMRIKQCKIISPFVAMKSLMPITIRGSIVLDVPSKVSDSISSFSEWLLAFSPSYLSIFRNCRKTNWENSKSSFSDYIYIVDCHSARRTKGFAGISAPFTLLSFSHSIGPQPLLQLMNS